MGDRITVTSLAIVVTFAVAMAAGAEEAGGDEKSSPPEVSLPKTVTVDGKTLEVQPGKSRVVAPSWKLSDEEVALRIAKLAPVPTPTLLDSAESAVKEQYQAQKAEVDALLAAPKPATGPLSWAFGELGMIANAYRFLETAEVAYENAEILRPSDHRWPYLLGHLHRRGGDNAKAREAFARAHRARTDDVPAVVWLASMELLEGDLDAAQEHIDVALDLDPECTQAYLVDGRIAYAREDYAAAVEKLERAFRLDLRSKTIRYALGLAYRAAGNLKRAERAMELSERGKSEREPPLMRDPVLQRMTAHNVGSRLWTRRGTQAARRGKHTEAIGYFAKALSLDPERRTLQVRYSRALIEGDRAADAILVLEPIWKEDPKEPRVLYHLALAYLSTDEHEKGEALLRSLLEIDPRHVNARHALARALLQAGRSDEALAELELAIEADPGDERMRVERAVHLMSLGKYPEALARLEQDAKVIPKATMVPLLLARLLASSPSEESRDAARSLELAKRLGESRSTNVVVAETVAMAHAENGDFETAIAWQKAAVQGAERAEVKKALERARERLEGYENKKPCRSPWTKGEEGARKVRVRVPYGLSSGDEKPPSKG